MLRNHDCVDTKRQRLPCVRGNETIFLENLLMMTRRIVVKYKKKYKFSYMYVFSSNARSGECNLKKRASFKYGIFLSKYIAMFFPPLRFLERSLQGTGKLGIRFRYIS
jgi:hypothetical protein